MSDGALVADLRLTLPTLALDVSLAVEPGEVLAVLGPNGAGKSTLLDLVAGLRRPDDGVVTLGAQTMTSVRHGRAAVVVPPERRRIGLLGQDPLVFPHLSALENVAFGPRAAGVPRGAARAEAVRLLDAVGLEERGAARPAELSGGQRARVALARALAARPRALLLDEPLAALDAEAAPGLRDLLRVLLRGAGEAARPVVLVTHDVLDAAVLADRVLVLDGGRVVDAGPTAQVLAAPRHAFTAALAGVEVVVGIARGGVVVAPDGREFAGLGEAPTGAAAAAVFAPSAVTLLLERPTSSARNVWSANVTELVPVGPAVRVRTSGDPQITVDVTPGAVAELGIRPGLEVWCSLKATEVRVHPR
ncbi:ABC transporter related [Beutenbergia cavernae DSM 12333]|uniref:ABC transporter related n=1 Tax=Beutenbergia cavernae (strain ATCC BAA-8 / DSM 12333 / CCUG 43141 / JCM 11478 / NBRC 16432 / NCIMB 13614 / HKI 0122) TaxID=471853 RepID=C5C1M5_BEUC1|nr:ATP-binding cassette domain-containing protein [Beutenbergia cavernae]ACQ79493.1 ABC transporter related [Beutenbergia cavernae DSM 12333]